MWFWYLLNAVVLVVIAVYVRKDWKISMSNQDKLDAIAARLDKIRLEVVGAVDELRANVAAGEVLDFTRIDAATAELDELNPDPEAEQPEPPTE